MNGASDEDNILSFFRCASISQTHIEEWVSKVFEIASILAWYCFRLPQIVNIVSIVHIVNIVNIVHIVNIVNMVVVGLVF